MSGNPRQVEFPGVPNPAREGPQPETTARGQLVESPTATGPGVLVLHAWWGLNQTVLDFAARLAAAGYTVLAPNLFGTDMPATTIKDAEKLATGSEADGGIAVEQAALGAADWLIAKTGGPIGAIGFSFGAAYALWLAGKRVDQVKAVVAYYGTAGPIKGTAPVMGHFAETDPYEPAENVDDLAKQLADQGRHAEISRYPGTHHWFAEPDRPEYDASAAAMAWERTLAFLQEQLGG